MNNKYYEEEEEEAAAAAVAEDQQPPAYRTNVAPDIDEKPASFAGRMEVLGPFGVTKLQNHGISLLGTDMYSIEMAGHLETLEARGVLGVGNFSPLHPVTLDARAREAAGIPLTATHFCWAYPLAGAADLDPEFVRSLPSNEPVVNFVLYGGFFYLEKQNLLRVNAVGLGDALYFSQPSQMFYADVEKLYKQGRFQAVTVPALKAYGCQRFCWINPNEVFGGVSTPYGAFVYLYTDKYVQYFKVMGSDEVKASLQKLQKLQISSGSNSNNNNNNNNNYNSNIFKPFAEFVEQLQQNRKDIAGSSDIAKLKQEISTLGDRFLCKVCMDNPLLVALRPCGHVVYCKDCSVIALPGSTCPICRAAVESKINVYI